MLDFFTLLALFLCKAIIVTVFILFIPILLLLLFKGTGSHKSSGKLSVTDLNAEYTDMAEVLYETILTKKEFKAWQQSRKKIEKNQKNSKNKSPAQPASKNIFVLTFNGDIKASAVEDLRKEITAILKIATSNDQVLLILNSAGGVIHGYGLAAAQLMRLRSKNIPLTVAVDKIAASGGYMMACVADHILASPFAIIGSIGVIVQLPNFHRLLQNKKIDFEQHTAGEFKRTLTVFGENTSEQREKLKEELNEMHQQFKQLISKHRPFVSIDKVATGEHWLGEQALALRLVDTLKTSDEYLLECSETANLYAVSYKTKKSLGAKLMGSVHKIYTHYTSRYEASR